MTDVKQLITEHLDIWLTAETEKKSGRGRSSGSNDMIYGVQKLRELILDFAFQGKLSIRNSLESSQILIAELNEIKQDLIDKGILKKQKKITVEPKYEIPSNWTWLTLQDYLDVRDGTHDTPKYVEKGFPLITSKNISGGKLDFSDVKYISKEDHEAISTRSKVEFGDILFAMIGSIGNPVLVDTEQEFSIKNVALFKPYKRSITNIRYVLKYLIYIADHLKANAQGAVQSFVSLNVLRGTAIPLPPLEEQQRIVEKVDELMQLCDQLEQQQTLSSDAHATLVDTLLKVLTESSDAEEFQDNWQRIVANFDVLFTTEYSIEQLKQTVLQLAVMGKLVKQDPSDEPASELLKQIADEKSKLIKESKIKKSKPLPEISDDEKPFELPNGWEWSRLNNIVSILGDGLHGTPEYEDNTGLYFINGNNLNDGVIEIKDHTKTVSKESFEKNKKDLCLRTMCVSINGTIGNVAFYNNEPVILGKSACYFNMIEPTSLLFMKLVFNSPYFFDYAEKSVTSTTIKNLSLASMNKFPIPLPPLSEQGLIVKKVDQLFSMIDQLQVLQSKLQKTKLHLADALVANAVENV
ncbi:restriction endonuclease subunit S [Acinetobacter sp. AGC35]